ncbi:MAG: hypothetical protein IT210_21300 [Armatimonadetes bacterium]|nr:hypothetical protein [Armatimonadota bacterium]
MDPRLKAKLPAIVSYALVWTVFHMIYYQAVQPGMDSTMLLSIFVGFALWNGARILRSEGWRRTQHILKAVWLILMIPAFYLRSRGAAGAGSVLFEAAVLLALVSVGLEMRYRIETGPAQPVTKPRSASPGRADKRKKKR